MGRAIKVRIITMANLLSKLANEKQIAALFAGGENARIVTQFRDRE